MQSTTLFLLEYAVYHIVFAGVCSLPHCFCWSMQSHPHQHIVLVVQIHWLSLAIRLYRRSFLCGPLDCIECPHGDDAGLYWSASTSVFMCKSLQENLTFWVSRYFTRSAQYVMFILFEWFVKWETTCCTGVVLLNQNLFK